MDHVNLKVFNGKNPSQIDDIDELISSQTFNNNGEKTLNQLVDHNDILLQKEISKLGTSDGSGLIEVLRNMVKLSK